VRAARRLGVGCVTASGGVTCNHYLRQELARACRPERLRLRISDRTYCTDNAAMVAMLAERKLIARKTPTTLDAEIEPGWSLDRV